MIWNFHNYYTNKTDGLISKLRLTGMEEKRLTELRDIVRIRVKDVFEEAKKIAKEVRSQESIILDFRSTNLRYLSRDEQCTIAELIFNLDDEARKEFLGLTPRFWTQGSFKYHTLNRPFHSGQEMDIDDGTYMPMPIFKSEPKIGHTLLLLLVDSSLKSLVAENKDWIFEAKQTCGRIKISKEKTHIDVPMYAIPKDQFLTKESANRFFLESLGVMDSADHSYEVDSKLVNMALREGDKKWLNSDPKIVEDWFNDSCSRIGKHLRKICRFMKAWRDAQWDVGGPSSISLMAATVNILDREPHANDDLDETMKIVAKHLANEFYKGVESPDPTDEKLLFPNIAEHTARENDIMAKLEALSRILTEAERADSKEKALDKINQAFGKRVTESSIIVSKSAAPAFKEEESKAESAVRISSTMVSG